MSKKGNAIDRINRMKKEAEAAKASNESADIVSQLTHETDGEPNFAVLASKLKKRKSEEKVNVSNEKVKYTIYVDKDVAAAFNALCIKHGDQRRYGNQALKEFVERKARELDLF